MKKIVVAILALALLSVTSFCILSGAVSAEKANVTIRENILYGDKSYAKGVTVWTEAHFDEHLFWDTAYTIGDTPTIMTDYEFHYDKLYQTDERNYHAVELDCDFRFGVDTSTPAEESVGLQKAYRELFDATAPGMQGKQLIRLQEYYTYYPVRVAIDLPGTIWNGNDYDRLRSDDYINERAVWDKFNAFFRIPIPEDLPPLEISVTKDSRGECIGVGSSGHAVDFYFNVRSAYTGDRVFFSIGNKYDLKDGEVTKYIDTSLIPGGYGIYSFTYKNVRNSKNTKGNATYFYPGYETGVEQESLAMVFPLEQHAEVIYLTLSNDEHDLLIFTRERGVTYLTVVETDSMTKRQKLPITEAQQFTFYEYDNCIVLSGWDYLSVIEKQEDGLCRLAFTVSRKQEINDHTIQKGVATAMAFDGKKLAIVDRTAEKTYGTLELCGFTVAIYDCTGLVYYGEYENSLSVAADPNNYAINCLPIRYRVCWTE